MGSLDFNIFTWSQPETLKKLPLCFTAYNLLQLKCAVQWRKGNFKWGNSSFYHPNSHKATILSSQTLQIRKNGTTWLNILD